MVCWLWVVLLATEPLSPYPSFPTSPNQTNGRRPGVAECHAAVGRGLNKVPFRGDVGSWVREASMEGLVSLTACLLRDHAGSRGGGVGAVNMVDGGGEGWLQNVVRGLICGMLQQAVERIARVREVGCASTHVLPALRSEHDTRVKQGWRGGSDEKPLRSELQRGPSGSGMRDAEGGHAVPCFALSMRICHLFQAPTLEAVEPDGSRKQLCLRQ